ncbi:MAG: UDP-N-acetylglucosamine 2-epimerase [bacterium]
MRRVAIVTGARAEYGILKPVIEAVASSPRLELQLAVTGMHLAPEHGYTVREIENDGFSIAARVEMLLRGDTPAAMGKGLGIGIYGLTGEIERLRPDIVLVLGDRVEAFAGAVAGLFAGAVVAHLHGGEITRGGLDEYMRHAITKLSHVHFTATEQAKQRVLDMGEHPAMVFCTGTPGLDALLRYPWMSDAELSQAVGFPLPERYALVIQHPVSTRPDSAGVEIMETLEALRKSGLATLLFYPNADAGGQQIVETIGEYKGEAWLRTCIHFPRPVYANLLRRAAVLAGNSSSGMIDSAAFGVPVVNIGDRQKGRERGDNVIDVPPEREAIARALQRAVNDETFIQQARAAKSPYGDGAASTRILHHLETLDLDQAKEKKWMARG